jgi:hypothetical protein
MSMNATFVQVDAAELSRFVAEPALVEPLFQQDAGVPDAANLAEAMRDRIRTIGPQMLADTAARLGKTPEELTAALGSDDLLKLFESRGTRSSAQPPGLSGNREVLSIEKAWHGVHFILCGEPEPGPTLLSQAVLGGSALGSDDEGFSGYGPARYFTAGQVAQLAAQLSAPELEAAIAGRFDAGRMEELGIYPGWSASDAGLVMDGFTRLRDFYGDAANRGNAIVTCLVERNAKTH